MVLNLVSRPLLCTKWGFTKISVKEAMLYYSAIKEQIVPLHGNMDGTGGVVLNESPRERQILR